MINDDDSIVLPTFQSLRQNFRNGKTRSVAYRKQQLKKLLQGLKELKSAFYEALREDLGYKNECQFEMMQYVATLQHVEHDIAHVEEYNKKRKVGTTLGSGPGTSYIIPEPRGVALVMGAWNYPLFTLLPAVSTCISAGNAVIAKPSELSAHTSNVIAKLFKTYLDSDFYQVIEGGVKVAVALTKQPLDLIFFVGGTEKGKLVAKAAADNLVPCILELGGKSPCIVDGTNDMNVVARRIIQTKFTNSGQTCVAPDYIIALENIKDSLLSSLKTELFSQFGKNFEDSEYLVKIVNEFHTKRVISYLESHGGEVFIGGNHNLTKRWIEPTIILNPKLDSLLMNEEIFGPILPIITVKSHKEAIDLINSRPKPLSLYYYGGDKAAKEAIINGTSSGGVCINDCLFQILNPELPFGGVGYSGYGTINGRVGFDQCCHLKSVLDKSMLDPSIRYAPYDNQKKQLMGIVYRVGSIRVEDIKQRIILGIVVLLLSIVYLNCHCGTEKTNGNGDL